ncbi:hypothetical protein ES708_08889 [subsurface metagenome]
MRIKFYLMTVLFLFLVCFPAGARVRLYIQSPPIVSAIPLFWMEEKGCLDEEVDFKVIVSSGHQAGLSLIDREEIQMLVTGVNVGAMAYNAGIGINLLNVNVWGIDYLLTYGFKADSWKNLKGKTLCLPLKGGPLDFVVRYLIEKTEIDIEEINLIYKSLPQEFSKNCRFPGKGQSHPGRRNNKGTHSRKKNMKENPFSFRAKNLRHLDKLCVEGFQPLQKIYKNNRKNNDKYDKYRS